MNVPATNQKSCNKKIMLLHFPSFIMTVVIAMMAQKARHSPIPYVSKSLRQLKLRPQNMPVQRAYCFTKYACKIVQRMGLLGSCVIESIVLSTLICDQRNVSIHIGFRSIEKGHTKPVDGHAWVSYQGQNISDPPVSSKQDFTESTCIKIS